MLSLRDLSTIYLVWATISTSLVSGQRTTYTGCHNHTEETVAIEYCFGPDGAETARATHSVAVATSLPESVSASATTAGAAQTTAVTGCHSHETAVFCINGAGGEVHVEATPTREVPPAYTGCHAHDTGMYCMDPAGNDVAVHAEGAAAEEEEEGHADTHAESEGQSCHFHAGVEHCVGGAEGEGVSCGLREREYNVGLRVGSLFIVLVTSAIGVLAPLLLHKLVIGEVGATVLTVVKQFGTGVIISTAFIHLYTHAQLMFSNECIGELSYEGTTSAIVMAGIFLSFLVEYVGLRAVAAHAARNPKTSTSTAQALGEQAKDGQNSPTSEEGRNRNAFVSLDHHHHTGPNSHLSVLMMEAGIIFHSVLIGLTLVVAGDSFYQTLLVVIVFHQFFEGLALGARISLLPGSIFPWKFVMAVAFALITPIGMAIGIGVLNTFNGNSPSTVITFGTLDALSAGILVWVGVVDMWARDWVIEGGELLSSGVLKTLGAGASLCAGMVLMGVLGKWA
ncbi:high-affinity Zn(2+) transporter zrt1 [Diaporthe australafricana]|uniref:High-affinity Zn(2+) transporter zrt1 n=1 Tax=Diaporthe australafricana TaxID=127596 RepID=A0ABR3X4T1_9PEZI